jgi:hypothetical protein
LSLWADHAAEHFSASFRGMTDKKIRKNIFSQYPQKNRARKKIFFRTRHIPAICKVFSAFENEAAH